MCNNFHTRGVCTFGTRCRYAHSFPELREFVPGASSASNNGSNVRTKSGGWTINSVSKYILHFRGHTPPKPVSHGHYLFIFNCVAEHFLYVLVRTCVLLKLGSNCSFCVYLCELRVFGIRTTNQTEYLCCFNTEVEAGL